MTLVATSKLLLERLAESREAIVRLLAAGSGDDETVADGGMGRRRDRRGGGVTDDETVAEEVLGDDETIAGGLGERRGSAAGGMRQRGPVPGARPAASLGGWLARLRLWRHPGPRPEASSRQVSAAEAPEA